MEKIIQTNQHNASQNRHRMVPAKEQNIGLEVEKNISTVNSFLKKEAKQCSVKKGSFSSKWC